MTEHSEISFGSTRIAYRIRRSARRKTVSIAVLPTDGVLITAPTRTSVPRLDALVHEKARWIIERLRQKRDVAETKPKREFVSGESFSYLGRQYRLRVVPNAAPVPIVMKAGWFHVHVPRGIDEEHRARYVRAALIDWYQRRARERIPGKFTFWAKKIGVPEPRVLVRDQQKRWASCDANGTVRVNWRIIQAGSRLLEYVLAHEVVHLVHDDHGPEFWSLLGRILPDYEDRRRELRRVGAKFDW